MHVLVVASLLIAAAVAAPAPVGEFVMFFFRGCCH